MEGYTKKHKLIKDTRRRKTEKRDRAAISKAEEDARSKRHKERMDDYRARTEQVQRSRRYNYVPYPSADQALEPERRLQLWHESRKEFVPHTDWADLLFYPECKKRLIETHDAAIKTALLLSLYNFLALGGTQVTQCAHFHDDLEDSRKHEGALTSTEDDLFTVLRKSLVKALKATTSKATPTTTKARKKEEKGGAVADESVMLICIMELLCATFKSTSIRIEAELGDVLRQVASGKYFSATQHDHGEGEESDDGEEERHSEDERRIELRCAVTFPPTPLSLFLSLALLPPPPSLLPFSSPKPH